MSQRDMKQVMRRICRVIYHVGTFEHSFPKILKGAQEFTRSHLVVLRECLPDLKHLIRYAGDTAPVVGQIVGLVGRGTADLVRASSTLKEVRQSTERAVTEIFGVLDRVDPLLAKAWRAEGGDEETRRALGEARGQLTLILNALQFQDITSQQIEATNALLADLGQGLATLAQGMGEHLDGLQDIEVRRGTFDPNASFDRGRASVDQADIDSLVEGNGPETPEAEAPGSDVPEKAPAPTEAGAASVNQDDIDALLSGGGEGSQAASSEGNGSAPETVGQDDIDALLKG